MFDFGLCSTSDDWPSNPAKNVNQTIKNEKGLLSHQQIKCLFWITFNFWWSAKRSKQKNVNRKAKNQKGLLSHSKIKCSFLDYVQLLMIGWVIWVMNGDWNAKKRPPKSSKIKCSFSDCLPEDCQKTARRPAEDYQKTARRLPEDHQKTVRRPPEDCQKTSRKPPEDC